MAKNHVAQALCTILDDCIQLHGAIGFTREYRLQPLTRRLLSWREECGNEAVWFEKLGALTLRPASAISTAALPTA